MSSNFTHSKILAVRIKYYLANAAEYWYILSSRHGEPGNAI